MGRSQEATYLLDGSEDALEEGTDLNTLADLASAYGGVNLKIDKESYDELGLQPEPVVAAAPEAPAAPKEVW